MPKLAIVIPENREIRSQILALYSYTEAQERKDTMGQTGFYGITIGNNAETKSKDITGWDFPGGLAWTLSMSQGNCLILNTRPKQITKRWELYLISGQDPRDVQTWRLNDYWPWFIASMELPFQVSCSFYIPWSQPAAGRVTTGRKKCVCWFNDWRKFISKKVVIC